MKAEFFYKDINAPKPNRPVSIGAVNIIEYDGKILMEHRTDSDLWSLIGGRMEMDETLLEGAIRETFEETGVELIESQLNYIGVYDDPTRIASYPDGNIVRIISFVYHTILGSLSDLVCSEESRELRFFSRKEIAELNVTRTHLPIILDLIS